MVLSMALALSLEMGGEDLTMFCSPLICLWEPWENSGLEAWDGDSHLEVEKQVLLQYSFMTPLIIEKSEKSVLGAQFPLMWDHLGRKITW